MVTSRISGGGNSSEGTAPEIISCKDILRLSIGHSLDHVGPLSGELDGCFPSFHPCVHWKNFIIFEELGDVFGIFRHLIAMESSRSQGQDVHLFLKSLRSNGSGKKEERNKYLHNSRVTMPLIDS